MPARTNDFQKLIKVINRHLAPTDAKITESAMLYDPEADAKREIDILVESTLLNCNIKIGIECTAVRSPLEIRQIESFKEKHRKVGINQTVVVSKNGFTDSAKKYAAKNQIKLLTFNSAKSENWLKTFERLKNLSVYGRNYFLRNVSTIIDKDKAEPGFIFNHQVTVISNGESVPINKFAGDLFISSEISKHAIKELKENEELGEDPWIEVGFQLDEKYKFRDLAGRVAKPVSISVVMGYKSKYRPLDTKQVSYDGIDLIVGGFFDKEAGDFAHVAINEVDGKIKGTLEVGEKFMPVPNDSRNNKPTQSPE
jgi:hypothetical protein